jgi:hypothetical protein
MKCSLIRRPGRASHSCPHQREESTQNDAARELLELLRSLAWEGMRYPVWEHSARYFANPMLVWPSD